MTAFQLLITFGILMAYVVDLVFTPTANWRAMFAIVLVPAFVLLIGMFFLPETPRWLVANRKVGLARVILRAIYASRADVDKEMRGMQKGFSESVGHWRELFSKPLLLLATRCSHFSFQFIKTLSFEKLVTPSIA